MDFLDIIQIVLWVLVLILSIYEATKKVKKDKERIDFLETENKKLTSDLIKLMQENIELRKKINADAE